MNTIILCTTHVRISEAVLFFSRWRSLANPNEARTSRLENKDVLHTEQWHANSHKITVTKFRNRNSVIKDDETRIHQLSVDSSAACSYDYDSFDEATGADILKMKILHIGESKKWAFEY
jgi:hypothetical protein